MSSDRVRALAQVVGDPRIQQEIRIAADACFAPIRVLVSGRTGVGKSSVRAALHTRHDVGLSEVVVEAASIDVPRAPDPELDGDVIVHVLAGGVHRADVDAVAQAIERAAAELVVVLAKADTVDDPELLVEQMSAAMGVTVFPLMSTIAVSLAQGKPESFDALRAVARAMTAEMLLTPDRFVAADLPVSRHERLELLGHLETFGIGVVTAALLENSATEDAILRVLLARRSGIDDVAQAVKEAVDGVQVQRDGRLLHRLTELAVQNPASCPEIEQYLASDEAVVAVMRAGLHALGEPETDLPTYETVQLWHERFRSAGSPAQARAALAVARGYMRLATR
ncbi:MAG: hypothetical protein WBB99_10540 [Rhodococcus sp. (in: high G+C Gram-positive bacteria)]